MTTTIRLAEVLAAISLASDVGHDQPLEKSLRNAAEHVATVAPALAPLRDAQWFATEGKLAGRVARDSACEVSMSLARRLGLSAAVQQSLDQVYERWDGYPGMVGGDDLHIPARISHVVDIAEIACACERRHRGARDRPAGARDRISTRSSPSWSSAARMTSSAAWRTRTC